MEYTSSLKLIISFVLLYGVCGGILPDQRNRLSTYESHFVGRSIGVHEKLSDRKHTKFEGGTPVEWQNFPFLVAVIASDTMLSGGVVIAEQYVLTSQDYINHERPEYLKVVAGSIEKEVTSIFTHHGYNVGNLAVLKLDSKFDLSGTNVTAIGLPDDTVPAGSNCTLVGWGDIFESASTEEALRFVNVPTVQISMCQNYWGREDEINEGHLCSGAFGEGSIDCIPNPGDPLLCDGVLSGIASILNLCDRDEATGIYGNVAYHKEWILEQMNKMAQTDDEITYDSASLDL